MFGRKVKELTIEDKKAALIEEARNNEVAYRESLTGTTYTLEMSTLWNDDETNMWEVKYRSVVKEFSTVEEAAEWIVYRIK